MKALYIVTGKEKGRGLSGGDDDGLRILCDTSSDLYIQPLARKHTTRVELMLHVPVSSWQRKIDSV